MEPGIGVYTAKRETEIIRHREVLGGKGKARGKGERGLRVCVIHQPPWLTKGVK
jgi:hypothetical protein